MKKIIASALALASITAALVSASHLYTAREVNEIGAAVIDVTGTVTTFRDRHGDIWVHDNFRPEEGRDYYMLVIDNMGTTYKFDDVIVSISED